MAHIKWPFRIRTKCLIILIFVVVFLIVFAIIHIILNILIRNNKKTSSLNIGIVTHIREFPRGGDELKLDQPWKMTDIDVYSFNNLKNLRHRIIFSNFNYSAGLGNLMFQYAALRTFAVMLNASVILPADSLLRRAFSGLSGVIFMKPESVNNVLTNSEKMYPLIEFKICCTYEPLNAQDIFENNNIVIINGYFQSFRYFHPHHEKLIRTEFAFLAPIKDMAQQILINAKRRRLHDNKLENEINSLTFVGMHVRHGMDITLHSRNLRHGHIAAPATYFKNAIDSLRQQYKTLVIIVISDNPQWARMHIHNDIPNEIIFIDSGYREVDLALICECNYTILSTGTFSWWAGYLNGGPVTYYAGWPRKGTTLEHMFNASDYFLPHWKSII